MVLEPYIELTIKHIHKLHYICIKLYRYTYAPQTFHGSLCSIFYGFYQMFFFFKFSRFLWRKIVIWKAITIGTYIIHTHTHEHNRENVCRIATWIMMDWSHTRPAYYKPFYIETIYIFDIWTMIIAHSEII